MPLDRGKISEGHTCAEAVQSFFNGGWGLFAKYGGEWKSYFQDGENGIIKDEAIALEMYDLVQKDPACESARLVRVEPVKGFTTRV